MGHITPDEVAELLNSFKLEAGMQAIARFLQDLQDVVSFKHEAAYHFIMSHKKDCCDIHRTIHTKYEAAIKDIMAESKEFSAKMIAILDKHGDVLQEAVNEGEKAEGICLAAAHSGLRGM